MSGNGKKRSAPSSSSSTPSKRLNTTAAYHRHRYQKMDPTGNITFDTNWIYDPNPNSHNANTQATSQPQQSSSSSINQQETTSNNQEEWRITICVGQSNMAGTDLTPTYPIGHAKHNIYDGANPNVLAYGASDPTVKVAAPTLPHVNAFADEKKWVNGEHVTFKSIGLGLNYGKTMANNIKANQKIVLGCHALGSSGFTPKKRIYWQEPNKYVTWDPGLTKVYDPTTGQMVDCKNLAHETVALINKIKQDNPDKKIIFDGILINMGETDTAANMSMHKFQENIHKLSTYIGTSVAGRKLPTLLFTQKPTYINAPYITMKQKGVDQAIREIKSYNGAYKVDNIDFVNCDNFVNGKDDLLRLDPTKTDHVHWGATPLRFMGYQAAKQMLPLIAEDKANLHKDLVTANESSHSMTTRSNKRARPWG